tara:strand:- start:2200 stop:2376 length:177 start_codon:yes stop_codon:yes gene_type:complete
MFKIEDDICMSPAMRAQFMKVFQSPPIDDPIEKLDEEMSLPECKPLPHMPDDFCPVCE